MEPLSTKFCTVTLILSNKDKFQYLPAHIKGGCRAKVLWDTLAVLRRRFIATKFLMYIWEDICKSSQFRFSHSPHLRHFIYLIVFMRKSRFKGFSPTFLICSHQYNVLCFPSPVCLLPDEATVSTLKTELRLSYKQVATVLVYILKREPRSLSTVW